MKRIVCLMVVCGLASAAMGAPVVSWTGTHDNTEGTALTKGALNGYTDENGPQQMFYDGANGPLTWWVEPGHMGVRVDGDSSATVGIYWTPGGTYSFDGLADTDVLFRFNLEDDINGNVAIYDNVAALVMNSGTLYRSPIIAADPGLTDYLVATKADLDETWKEYDISTGALVDGGAEIALDDLDDITAFGGSFAPSSGNIYISSFEAVPEPATMSVLAMGGLAALIRRRRK
jgi:hypothetical protein